jgi:uncharacterized protein with FMN-binding domain
MQQNKTPRAKKLAIPTAKLLMYFAVVFVMFCSYLIVRHKNQVLEAKNLPFYNTSLEAVDDGTYYGKTYTKFLHVQLEVTVQNHQLQNIKVLENKGSQGQNAEPILQEMIKQNKVVVPAIKGEELASLVFISCVDTALHSGAGQKEVSE